MFMRYLYTQTGLNHFHSTDLADMRRALLDEDDDEPDGGSADVSARQGPQSRQVADVIACRRDTH